MDLRPLQSLEGTSILPTHSGILTSGTVKIIHLCVFSHHVCRAIYHCSNGKLTQLQVSISKVGCTVWLAGKGPDTWNCGIGKEKVGFNWDLVSGIGICVIDRSWVSLDPVIKLCSPASLKSKQRWLHEARIGTRVLFTAVSHCSLRTVLGMYQQHNDVQDNLKMCWISKQSK